MNAHDVLDMIGDAKSTYVWDAQGVRLGEMHTEVRRISGKKILLLAALVSLLLMLVGCTVVYIFHLQDLKIGEHTVIAPESSSSETVEIDLDVLSLQGITGSANYLANQEWLAFTKSYEPELGDYWVSEEEYWAYTVLDQVMVDKLDAICEKYGLQVIGKPWHEHVDCNAFLPLVGVKGLLNAESDAQLHIPQGRFFPGGSFTVYGSLTISGTEERMDLTYHCVRKDVFYDVFAYVNPETATERNYTTKDGMDLLLVQSDHSGMILADRQDSFISISVTLPAGVSLEAIADQFDFTIQTVPPDAAAAEERQQASIDEAYGDEPDRDMFRRSTYREYVEDLLQSDDYKLANGFAPSEIPQREYTFYDLDGNGIQELLILYQGRIGSVVGMKNGKTDEGKSYSMILCQDNILVEQMQLTADECWYHIFRFANDGDPVFSNPKEESIVRLKEQNGTWWRTSSTDHYADFDTQITEAQAMEILNAYTPVTLDTKPLTEFEEP